MKLEEFSTDTYVRRPFQVQAFEITQDNIAELAPHVGELCDDDGTPFIKSDKKKVGNNFKVWPGFFATVLKGHVRCYSRKTFFEQFGELTDKTAPAVEFLHGRITFDELGLAVAPTIDSEPLVPEPVVEEAPEPEPVAEVEEVVEAVPVCEHGTPEGQECIYKKCDGPEGDEDDEDDVAEEAHGGADEDDVPEPAEGTDAVEKYRSALEGVIKS